MEPWKDLEKDSDCTLSLSVYSALKSLKNTRHKFDFRKKIPIDVILFDCEILLRGMSYTLNPTGKENWQFLSVSPESLLISY